MKSAIGWIIAIPAALLAIYLLQAAPFFAIELARNTDIRLNLLSLLLALILVPMFFYGLGFWFFAVFAAPSFICAKLTRAPQVSITIVGTAFALSQGLYLYWLTRAETSAGVWVYQIVFPVMILGGLYFGASRATPAVIESAKGTAILAP